MLPFLKEVFQTSLWFNLRLSLLARQQRSCKKLLCFFWGPIGGGVSSIISILGRPRPYCSFRSKQLRCSMHFLLFEQCQEIWRFKKRGWKTIQNQYGLLKRWWQKKARRQCQFQSRNGNKRNFLGWFERTSFEFSLK